VTIVQKRFSATNEAHTFIVYSKPLWGSEVDEPINLRSTPNQGIPKLENEK